MYWNKIDSDGDYEILNFPTKRDSVSIVIDSNPDGATIDIGYRGNDQTFKAYADGAGLTDDTHALVGEGVRLMARVAGTSGGTLIIGVASYGA